ncbi:MAG: hypothetical protein WA140_06610 [Geobacteraceae bacterium]
MAEEIDQNDDLISKVRKIIKENRKFLDRVMDDEFEPETGEEADAG